VDELTLRADMNNRAGISLRFEAEAITRYWPERDGVPGKPDRAFRIEVLLPCSPCAGLGRGSWDETGRVWNPGTCEWCDGQRSVWTPLHWVEQKRGVRGARSEWTVIDDVSPNA
jgi:hypothetical protein